ncbi:MAG: hypothetical protein SGJ20_20125 [Planctomycetota bacterium]|nr:hypothetical protein [Planctomycetota bacterium]
MKLAILGIDDTVERLVEIALRDSKNQLVYIADIDSKRTVSHWKENGAQKVDWEYLLAGNAKQRGFDALIVAAGGNSEVRMDQLRKLVQAAVPLLVVHPAFESMLWCYELEMIRAESGGVLVPFLPARSHPVASRLRDWLSKGWAESESSELGQVDQVVFERAMHRPSRSSVQRQFAIDVDLIQFLCGDVKRLGAMGSPGKNAQEEFNAYGNLGVQLAGEGHLFTRWNVVPIETVPGGRLIVSGTRGKAIWSMPEGSNDWPLEVRRAGESRHELVEESQQWDPYVAALDRMQRAVQGEAVTPTWNTAARAVELADTIQRSLKKNRTIELHQEEFTDIGTFKGFMTSLGCALLMGGLAVLVAALIAAQLFKSLGWPRTAEFVGRIPYLLLAVFGIFLFMQLILKIVGTKPGSPQPPGGDDSPAPPTDH